jgi:class 3 adenylate cyclase
MYVSIQHEPTCNHGNKQLISFFFFLVSDITGFTAWCSEREPSQVFILLESIYSAYDAIAKKRKVFKVETIGDCYMAVTGLPEPREDHAVLMCRFARECLNKLRQLLAELEVTLGPGK